MLASCVGIIFLVGFLLSGIYNLWTLRADKSSAMKGFKGEYQLAGVGAGQTPEFIEMMQVGHGCRSGSARLVGR
jgi:hypothetical protein